MIGCVLCSGNHTHLFYCGRFQKAGGEERFALAKKAGICFRCLVMAAKVDFEDRKAWFEQHKATCETEWYCKQAKCGDKPKTRQMHFLLCLWHSKKNSEVEAQFNRTLDKSQMSGPVKFFFNLPVILNWAFSSQAAQPEEGWSTLPDVDSPAIFMLCNLMIKGTKFLCFFDSGCMTATISERVKQVLNTETTREGPTKISVASGKVLKIPGGEERLSIPLSDGTTRCTITALCMPHVTTPFPVWNTEKAVKYIEEQYKSLHTEGEE